MSQVKVVLKSGKTISVMRDEVQGLRDAGLLKGAKAKEEKKETKTKEDKGAGTITKANIKK
jgi:hypothetical protein